MTNVRTVRIASAGVGVAVGAIFAALAALTPLGEPFVPPGWMVPLAILAGGGIGGWLMGPSAWRTSSVAGWVAVIVVLAVLAVVIGDAVTVALLAGSALTQGPAGTAVHGPAEGLIGVVELFLLGLLVTGWFYAIFAMIAAGIWAFVIALLRRRLGRAAPAAS